MWPSMKPIAPCRSFLDSEAEWLTGCTTRELYNSRTTKSGEEGMGFRIGGEIEAMDYLPKTEPTEYSFAELQKDGKTAWDGECEERGGNGQGGIGGCERSEEAGGEDQGEEGAGEAGATRGDQEEPAVQRFSSG